MLGMRMSELDQIPDLGKVREKLVKQGIKDGWQESDAQDFAHSALVKLQQRRCESVRNRIGYLHRVATNIASDTRKNAAREACVLSAWHEVYPAGLTPSPEEYCTGEMLLDSMDCALAESVDRFTQSLFKASRIAGISAKEIARATGLTPKSVEQRLGRLAIKLRTALPPG